MTTKRFPVEGTAPLILAFVTAALSGVAVLLHAIQWVTLPFTLSLLAPLTAVTFAALVIRGVRAREQIFLNRLGAGLLTGVAGLLAYDLVRLILLAGGVPFNPFRPIEVFGLLILGRTEDTALTKTVGWAFHIWNGLAFASMYTLAFGRGRLLYAIAWSLILEFAMLGSYPALFQMVRDRSFLTVSLTGHLAYGTAIGLMARRTVRW